MTNTISQPLPIPHNVRAPFYWSESVFRNIFKEEIDKIVLGGGTVLAMHWNHRLSTDLDYFITEPNLITARNLINRTEEPLKQLHSEGQITRLDQAAYHTKFFIHDTEVTLFTTQALTQGQTTHHEKNSQIKLTYKKYKDTEHLVFFRMKRPVDPPATVESLHLSQNAELDTRLFEKKQKTKRNNEQIRKS